MLQIPDEDAKHKKDSDVPTKICRIVFSPSFKVRYMPRFKQMIVFKILIVKWKCMILTFSCGSNDDRHMTKSLMDKLNIGEMMYGSETLSIIQLMTHRGPRILNSF